MSGAVRAFAPASVSNVACGFDVLGFALEGQGDVVCARVSPQPGVVVISITGDGGRIPKEPARNTAARAAQAVIDRLGSSSGLVLEIEKQMPLSSGLGSSAASAVAAAVAANQALGGGLESAELLTCALTGESVASGALHGDNVAPALYGGLVLVRALEPVPDIVPLPVPSGLTCALAVPRIEIETLGARRLLPEELPLTRAVRQWANVGALVAALFRRDFDLLARALCDEVSEPVRSRAIPGFEQVKRSALRAGALGCSISGSGPAVFALCESAEVAEVVAATMVEAFHDHGELNAAPFVSGVGAEGARVTSSLQDAGALGSRR